MQKLVLKENDNKLLKANYFKALQDESFNKFIDKLNISNDILCKYTTRLQESSKENENCLKCKNLLSCQNKIHGYCLTPIIKNDFITFSYQICKFKEKNNLQNQYLKNIYFYELSPEIKNASFKNIYRDDSNRLEIIKKIKNFYDKYKDKQEVKGIYLNGNFGSGKSYLIVALFNELAKLNYQSAMIYFPEFLRSLKSSFGLNNEEYQEKYEYIKKVPLLLIDDIGAEKLTDWARDEILGSILQYRMDFKLPTFFTSNLTISELENHLKITSNSHDKVKARRIIERIKFLTDEVVLIGVNRRSE